MTENYLSIIENQTFSVTDAVVLVNDILNPLTLNVVGEVSEFKISQNKWVYFNLKDEQSTVNCFMTIYQLPFALEDGMQIKVTAQPKIYAKTGKFSFTIKGMELVGEGNLLKAFEQLKMKCEMEGLFDAKWKQTLPFFPTKIGLITSKTGDALHDICRILQLRAGGLKLFLLPVAVQGQSAVTEIVAAIQHFNAHLPVDEIIVARGGGSIEDLQAFNSEPVVRAVFASKIPIISGVGHEPDVTLIDLVADKRATTPTNAAELAVPDFAELTLQLNQYNQRILSAVRNNFYQISSQIETLSQKLLHELTTPLRRIDNLAHRLSVAANLAFEKSNQQIHLWQAQLDNLNPLAVLQRGYSITQKQGKVITSAASVAVDDEITTIFIDGKIESKIIKRGEK